MYEYRCMNVCKGRDRLNRKYAYHDLRLVLFLSPNRFPWANLDITYCATRKPTSVPRNILSSFPAADLPWRSFHLRTLWGRTKFVALLRALLLDWHPCSAHWRQCSATHHGYAPCPLWSLFAPKCAAASLSCQSWHCRLQSAPAKMCDVWVETMFASAISRSDRPSGHNDGKEIKTKTGWKSNEKSFSVLGFCGLMSRIHASWASSFVKRSSGRSSVVWKWM